MHSQSHRSPEPMAPQADAVKTHQFHDQWFRNHIQPPLTALTMDQVAILKLGELEAGFDSLRLSETNP